MAKKVFRVEASVTTYCVVLVEAESQEEANSKADEMDGGVFHSLDEQGDWDIQNTATREATKEEIEKFGITKI